MGFSLLLLTRSIVTTFVHLSHCVVTTVTTPLCSVPSILCQKYSNLRSTVALLHLTMSPPDYALALKESAGFDQPLDQGASTEQGHSAAESPAVEGNPTNQQQSTAGLDFTFDEVEFEEFMKDIESGNITLDYILETEASQGVDIQQHLANGPGEPEIVLQQQHGCDYEFDPNYYSEAMIKHLEELPFGYFEWEKGNVPDGLDVSAGQASSGATESGFRNFQSPLAKNYARMNDPMEPEDDGQALAQEPQPVYVQAFNQLNLPLDYARPMAPPMQYAPPPVYTTPPQQILLPTRRPIEVEGIRYSHQFLPGSPEMMQYTQPTRTMHGNAYLPTPSPSPAQVPLSGSVPPPPPALLNDQSHIPAPVRAKKAELSTPKSVDMRLIRTVITADEILAYLPNHTMVYECLFRLVYNGWTQGDIASANNFFRDLQYRDAYLPNTITKRMTALENAKHKETGENGGEAYKNISERKKTGKQWFVFDTSNWTKPSSVSHFIDYPLAHLAKGLVHRPWGEGHGPLSKCIEYAEHNLHLKLKVSDVPRIMAEQGFQPIRVPSGRNIDKDAYRRLKDHLLGRGYRCPDRKRKAGDDDLVHVQKRRHID